MLHKVKFLQYKKEVEIPDNTDLLSAIIKAGIEIRSTCAGQGTCGACKVQIKSGEYFTSASPWISKEEKNAGFVLACQTAVLGDMVVDIPAETKLEKIQAIGSDDADDFEDSENLPETATQLEENKYSFQPIARKIHLNIPEPSLEDITPDFERLKRELTAKTNIENFTINLALLRALSKFLRQSKWEVTVSIAEFNGTFEIIHLEAGDTTKNSYGIALDIGTTTVVAYLTDLNTQKIVASKGTYNLQMSFGEDVITRMIFAGQKDGLQKLQKSVHDTINSLLHALITENEIFHNDILAITVAGNTTMIHLFLGISPEFIRKEPYIPSINFPLSVYACELGIKINQRGIISCLPGVASYVGGDITAGVLACGMQNSTENSLLIDLGTNGEIALGNSDWIVTAACSAGPAFEGVGIKSGIRAVDGAIQEIEISDDKKEVKYQTINNKKPKGICGTGLIDIPAELLRRGIINRDGKFASEKISSRLRRNMDGELEFVIAYAPETQTNSDIVITEPDIANLIRSKGAIFLGIEVLLQEMNLKFEDINKIYISGGFGTYLDIEKAIMLGLLPDLPRNKFQFIGNSSITGAKICLLSKEARDKAKETAEKMTYIDLSTNPKFMNEYTSTLFLPHTNIDLFPSVKNKIL
ncbi:MAG: DUF4445 domain-containing protein [Elusimicrobia bacterium]|nr:DUF4445 domain-containing protein [Elusimicrobiota bacterium]